MQLSPSWEPCVSTPVSWVRPLIRCSMKARRSTLMELLCIPLTRPQLPKLVTMTGSTRWTGRKWEYKPITTLRSSPAVVVTTHQSALSPGTSALAPLIASPTALLLVSTTSPPAPVSRTALCLPRSPSTALTLQFLSSLHNPTLLCLM